MVWSHASGSPVDHCSQTKVGSGHCWSTLQTGAPHSGPFTTSTQEQPVWTDAPLANTSYGRQVSPSGQAPLQVGEPAEPQDGGGSVPAHASTSASSADAVPVHAPFPSAFAIVAENFASTFPTHSATASGPLTAFLAHAALSRAFTPAALSLIAAQLASPEMASLNVVAQALAADCAASASPGQSPFASALAK